MRYIYYFDVGWGAPQGNFRGRAALTGAGVKGGGGHLVGWGGRGGARGGGRRRGPRVARGGPVGDLLGPVGGEGGEQGREAYRADM